MKHTREVDFLVIPRDDYFKMSIFVLGVLTLLFLFGSHNESKSRTQPQARVPIEPTHVFIGSVDHDGRLWSLTHERGWYLIDGPVIDLSQYEWSEKVYPIPTKRETTSKNDGNETR